MTYSAINLFFPVGSRRRVLARQVYTKLAALTGKDSSTLTVSYPTLSSEALAALEAALRMFYFDRQTPGYLETKEGLTDLANHLTTRLQIARVQVVPWLNPSDRCRVRGCLRSAAVLARL
jgi:hypothetical protein